jgi:hypothetical protein
MNVGMIILVGIGFGFVLLYATILNLSTGDNLRKLAEEKGGSFTRYSHQQPGGEIRFTHKGKAILITVEDLSAKESAEPDYHLVFRDGVFRDGNKKLTAPYTLARNYDKLSTRVESWINEANR